MKPNFDLFDVDSDSDGAPEEVTLKDAYNAFSETKRDIEKGISSLKQKKKQKNRDRDQLFKSQKETKKARLEAKPLPEDIFNDLSDGEETQQIVSGSTLVTTGLSKGTHQQFSSDDEEADEKDSGIDSVIKGKVSIEVVQNIKAKTFKAATDFRYRKQAGVSANIKRQSAKELQLIKEKKKANRMR